MPLLPRDLVARADVILGQLEHTAILAERKVHHLIERINIPFNNVTSPPGLIEAETRDPWSKSGKYALGWVYFSIILLVFAAFLRFYSLFTDRIRTALYQEEVQHPKSKTYSPESEHSYEMSNLFTDRSTNKLFPRAAPHSPQHEQQVQPTVSSLGWLNNLIALFRYVFYRPISEFRLRKGWRPIIFPSLAVSVLSFAALAFVTLYCFVPQPLYWQDIQFGSPPLAIRAGMLAISMLPWIIATAMKANLVSMLTGIGHERLNVLHRWMAYICLFLSLVHTVPFYIASAQDAAGFAIYKSFFNLPGNFYIFSSGIAVLVPLLFLCIHSVWLLRNWMYELFVVLHVPVSIIYVALLFWHCKNYLTSYSYLYATIVIWLSSYVIRIFAYLNWTHPFRMSWLVGDESAVTLMPENAIKITIPTQVKWKPGQYVYIRMPGISVFENHPFTIASLCSDDFPSEYGEGYRDMVIVFRPFGGFTNRVLNSALDKGPWHTYRVFIDGPYGGMRRRLDAFDDVVLIAGGSGITAIVSQLLDLIKRMRDGKAVTKNVSVIWALKRPETMDWFREELRICREFAPPDSVQCQFFITAAKRQPKTGAVVSAHTPARPVSIHFHEKMNEAFQGIAEKRLSSMSTKRHSALIADEAQGDMEIEKQLRRENEDSITALPQAHVVPVRNFSQKGRLEVPRSFAAHRGYELRGSGEDKRDQDDPDAITAPDQAAYGQAGPGMLSMRQHNKSKARNLAVDVAAAIQAGHGAIDPAAMNQPSATSWYGYGAGAGEQQQPQAFDFGFPSTPTEFQKNLMRFAFLPAAVKRHHDGWSTEYGRPQIPFMLREMSRGWGRRTCVFVCGPPSMRVAVSREVAALQSSVWQTRGRDEIYLHAENYAI